MNARVGAGAGASASAIASAEITSNKDNTQSDPNDASNGPSDEVDAEIERYMFSISLLQLGVDTQLLNYQA